MSYATPFVGWDTFSLWQANFFLRVDELQGVIDTIASQNLDTVEGARQAMSTARGMTRVRGRDLFSDTKRFPGGFRDAFLSFRDGEVFRTWNSLLRALEYRDTVVAKDMQTGKQPNSQSQTPIQPTAEKTSQSLQDNRKVIIEDLNRLEEMCMSEALTWTQRKFEEKLVLIWTAAAAVPGGNP